MNRLKKTTFAVLGIASAVGLASLIVSQWGQAKGIKTVCSMISNESAKPVVKQDTQDHIAAWIQDGGTLWLTKEDVEQYRPTAKMFARGCFLTPSRTPLPLAFVNRTRNRGKFRDIDDYFGSVAQKEAQRVGKSLSEISSQQILDLWNAKQQEQFREFSLACNFNVIVGDEARRTGKSSDDISSQRIADLWNALHGIKKNH